VLFCQATFVPVGPVVLGFLSGSTARAVDGSIMGHDVETQARACLRRIDDTLREAGGDLRDVVRLRAFVVGALDDDVMTQLHAARSEVFDIEHCPASTVVSVGGLAMPGLLIEIEADAVLDAPVGSDQGSSTVGGS
jgi:enamine deaminase RidA (YjgF/YER057c/UK114 family)